MHSLLSRPPEVIRKDTLAIQELVGQVPAALADRPSYIQNLPSYSDAILRSGGESGVRSSMLDFKTSKYSSKFQEEAPIDGAELEAESDLTGPTTNIEAPPEPPTSKHSINGDLKTNYTDIEQTLEDEPLYPHIDKRESTESKKSMDQNGEPSARDVGATYADPDIEPEPYYDMKPEPYYVMKPEPYYDMKPEPLYPPVLTWRWKEQKGAPSRQVTRSPEKQPFIRDYILKKVEDLENTLKKVNEYKTDSKERQGQLRYQLYEMEILKLVEKIAKADTPSETDVTKLEYLTEQLKIAKGMRTTDS